ncbi:diguanylate cyclase (GGDEF)-like protein [Sphingomonas zeicaulis]|uniref:diguanylate cyclase domain-containing protein n=1 Tax=Sphingomonas zeicaulis TaxID=1632740 RepID=UPI003D22D5AF
MVGLIRRAKAGLRRNLVARGWRATTPLPEPVYRDLVVMLFTMALPIAGLGVLLLLVSGLLAWSWRDPVLSAIGVTIALVTLWRLWLIARFHRHAVDDLPIVEMRRWEWRYALGSHITAALLSTLGVWALQFHTPIVHMIIVSLMFTFGAGIVSRIAIRPAICVPSMVLATLPIAIALGVHATLPDSDALHPELFAIESLLVLIVTGLSLQSIAHIYRSTIEHLTTKHELSLLALQDALTGLPNRLLLRNRFREELRAVVVHKCLLALHFLDLDGFKAVNDRFGHPAGDALLRQVAERLSLLVRDTDTVARLGGDEFVIVQSRIHHVDEAEVLARRVLRQLSAPYDIEGKQVLIGVSVGIAIAPLHGSAWEGLSVCADEALYQAKARGKSQFAFCVRGARAADAGYASSAAMR